MLQVMFDRARKDGGEQYRADAGGFTLLELMVTVAVAAILATVAIPAYQGMVQRNGMTAAVNTLVAAINFARSEAITRGEPVYICASNDGATCGGSWLDGWIVYAPDYPNTAPTTSNVLRVHGAVEGPQLQITNDPGRIEFGGSGFLVGLGNDSLTLASQDTQNETCVVISKAGRVSTETGYYGDTGNSCNTDNG